MLPNIVKLLYNVERELLVVVDPRCSEWVVAGDDYFDGVVLHHAILNIALQHDVVVLRFAGEFFT